MTGRRPGPRAAGKPFEAARATRPVHRFKVAASVVCLVALAIAGCVDEPEPAPAPDQGPEVLRLLAGEAVGGWLCDPCGQRFSTGGIAWEPHVEADPDDPGRIVVFTGDGGGPVFYRTDDGGMTWSRDVYPIGPEAMQAPQAAWLSWGDPGLAWSAGELHVVALGNRFVGAASAGVLSRDVWSMRSGDGGQTFTDPVIVTSARNPQVFAPAPAYVPFATPDREMLAVRDGEAMVTWVLIHSPDGLSVEYDLQAARSQDAGQTWSGPEQVFVGGSPRGPYPFYLDGVAHVAFASYGDGALRVAVDDGGWALHELGEAHVPTDVAVNGSVAVIATAVPEGEGMRAAAYVWDGRGAERLLGPVAQGDVAHVSVAFVGDEIWLAWYEVADNATYRISRFHGGSWVGDLIVEDTIQGEVRSFGDYIFSLNGAADHATATYVVGDDDGRWLHHARIEAVPPTP